MYISFGCLLEKYLQGDCRYFAVLRTRARGILRKCMFLKGDERKKSFADPSCHLAIVDQ
jgi:hypothetical protein